MNDLTFRDKTVLGIDTSGKIASCAIMRGETLLGESTFVTNLTHSQIILPTVLRVLSDCSLELSDIDLFAVAAGPGSYTGLRIGIAAVKGLCAGGKDCIGVSTLEAIAYNVCTAKGLIIPALFARQGIAYFGAYESDGKSLSAVCPDRVGDESDIKELALGFGGDVILTGDCAKRLKDNLFADDERVCVSAANVRLQSASGVCMAALAHIDEASDAGKLGARYLQNTMAEKLKDREKTHEAQEA